MFDVDLAASARRMLGAALAPVLLCCSCLVGPDATAGEKRRHALSLVGKPKLAADFKHFDWVDPDAPKGGRVRIRAMGSYDTLNRYAVRGSPAAGLSIIYDTLFAQSLDEPATSYGLVAEWVSHPDDFTSATFGLRPEARFHDGRPVTADDVAFSLEAIKRANPRYALYYKNVVRADVEGPHRVRFVFDGPGNRELPDIVAGLPVLPRHFWAGKDERGEPRDLARGTMEPPIGSGPYRVHDINAGRTITYARVADWWARNLPVARGQWNFDEITFVYYRDRLPAFEAFKTGETDFWPESSAKAWATGYDFDAVKRGHINKAMIESGDIKYMQGFVFNQRRRQFQDPRVRRAFNLAFNYEWANDTMFYGQYRRVGSYFENSELKATGLPDAAERAILEPVKDRIPAEALTAEYSNPVNRTPEDFRRHMREAARLLAEAGYTMKEGVLTNPGGDRLTAEFLLVQPDFERLVLAYKAELERLGMKITVRLVDNAQYTRRIQTYDFDIVIASFPQSISPGNEQREMWGSAAADRDGTRNLMGLKNPGIDMLIERLIFAKDRADLVAASRALDRVLLWGHNLVPQFYAPAERVAYWQKFAHPTRQPRHSSSLAAFLQVWWHDDKAAAALAEARRR